MSLTDELVEPAVEKFSRSQWVLAGLILGVFLGFVDTLFIATLLGYLELTLPMWFGVPTTFTGFFFTGMIAGRLAPAEIVWEPPSGVLICVILMMLGLVGLKGHGVLLFLFHFVQTGADQRERIQRLEAEDPEFACAVSPQLRGPPLPAQEGRRLSACRSVVALVIAGRALWLSIDIKESQMKLVRKNAYVYLLLGLLALVSILAGCSKAVPQDGAQAKMMRFDGLNNLRYCEIFLIGGNPITKDLQGAVYNTTAAERRGPSSRHLPGGHVGQGRYRATEEAIRLTRRVQERTTVLDVRLDRVARRDAARLRWSAGALVCPRAVAQEFQRAGSTYYKPTTVHRASHQGYKAGQTVFILDDPNGTPWLMQAYSLIVDPSLTYDDLKTLDKKLKLPAGWKYRYKVLDKDLEVGAINGTARIVQDDLEGTYNACFEEAGQCNCTYKP